MARLLCQLLKENTIILYNIRLYNTLSACCEYAIRALVSAALYGCLGCAMRPGAISCAPTRFLQIPRLRYSTYTNSATMQV